MTDEIKVKTYAFKADIVKEDNTLTDPALWMFYESIEDAATEGSEEESLLEVDITIHLTPVPRKGKGLTDPLVHPLSS